MPVITVSGGLASGAREVAQAAAREIGIDYVDQEIMVQAAGQLGVKVADVESRDERKSSIGERMASVLRTLMERSAAAGAADPLAGGSLEMVLARTYGEAADLPDEGTALTDERYLKTLTSVVKGIAARGNVVILGRGSQAILRDMEEALHVWVAAPFDHRVALLVEREGTPKAEAEKRIRQSDQQRQAFHRHYFKIETDTPAMYDVGFNSARIGIPTAAKMIALAAKEKAPRPG